MKKFVIKMTILIIINISMLIVAIPLSAVDEWSMMFAKFTNSEEYNRASTQEIIPYIEKVQEKNSQYSKIIVGDSVCHQIFNRFQDYNNEYLLVGSNQAVTYVGQYLLVEEFVKNNQNITDVYLVLRSVYNGFDNVGLTYQYLVTPFSEKGMYEKIDSETKEELEKIYGSFFLQQDIVKMIDHSPVLKKLYLNNLKENEFDKKEITELYIKKFIQLCDENNINFHFLHAPMSESDRNNIEMEEQEILEYIEQNEVKNIIAQYYDTVLFYPENCFKDGIHFIDGFENETMMGQIIKEIQFHNDVLHQIKLDKNM